MPIDIQEDFDQPDGGYAIVTLPQSIGDGDGSLRIRRLAGEPDKLGPKGWQPHDTVVTPLSVREVGTKTALYFGPALTQHLLEETELEITVPALNTTERVVWPYITPSVNADGGRGSVGGATPTADVPTTPKPVPPVGPPIKTDLPDETDGTDPPIAPPIDEADTDKGFNWLWLVPIVAVAALVVFFVLPLDFTPTPPPVDPDDTTQTAGLSEDPDPAPVAAADTRESLMAEAVACRDAGCDGAAYLDIANRLKAIGVTDLFAVMGLAAENGSVAAMEWLATSFDPLHFEENEGLSNPDLGSAFLYYGQAEDAGSDQAAPAKAALCAALRTPGDADWAATLTDTDIRTALEGNCP